MRTKRQRFGVYLLRVRAARTLSHQ
eukprot:COSAG01_NODE_36781_length_512_cov_3.065375_1_plen_24_part_10